MMEDSGSEALSMQKSDPSSKEMTANSKSRQAGTNSATTARSKRNRYISLACSECRRRKIKCNGFSPCQRCGHMKLECLYAPNCCTSNFKDSEEFRAVVSKIESLDTQVQTLLANSNELHQPKMSPRISAGIPSKRRCQPSCPLSKSHAEESTSRIPLSQLVHPTTMEAPTPKRPRFHGPMSNAFTFDVAKSGLPDMGIDLSYTENNDYVDRSDSNLRYHRDTSTSTVQGLRKDSSSSADSSLLSYTTLPKPTQPLQHSGHSQRGRQCQLSPSLPYPLSPSKVRTAQAHQPIFQNYLQKPQQLPPFPQLLCHPTKDPIHAFSREEALRLLAVYEGEVGLLYPLLDAEKVAHQAHLLFNFLEAVDRADFATPHPSGEEVLLDDDTYILKVVLAIALSVEGNGENALGSQLFASLENHIHQQMADAAYLKSLQFLALVAIYHFTTDDDTMAYRRIGGVSRMCLEMGLHSQEGINRAFPASETDVRMATKIFWTIYTLDRRFSFGTGLPFSLQDADISLSEADYLEPYLKAMIPFYRLGSKLWYSGLGFRGDVGVNHEQIECLDSGLLKWAQTLPKELRSDSYETSHGHSHGVNRNHYRLHIVTYIRTNCMRMLIYRPVLHSTKSIMDNMSWARQVVDIAKDTVRVLTQLNQSSDIYCTLQVMFNFFLISSLGVLILAISHAPSQFSALVRDEFNMALSLIKDFSQRSFVSKRLWKMIRNLYEIGRELGLVSPSNTPVSQAKQMTKAPTYPHSNPHSYLKSVPDHTATIRSHSFDSALGGMRRTSTLSTGSSAPHSSDMVDSQANADSACHPANDRIAPSQRATYTASTTSTTSMVAKDAIDGPAKPNSLNSTDAMHIRNELTNFFKAFAGHGGFHITSDPVTESGWSKDKDVFSGRVGGAAARVTLDESRCNLSQEEYPGLALSSMDLAWI